MADYINKLEKVSRTVQWRIDTSASSYPKRSDFFKLGNWNWQLGLEKIDNARRLYVRLFLDFEPSSMSLEETIPSVRYILRVSNTSVKTPTYVSNIEQKYLRNDFICPVDILSHGRLVIDMEFLDLIIDPYPYKDWTSAGFSIWAIDQQTQTVSTRSTLRCLSRMLEDGIHADVTIITADGGNLRAHKAILAASSPVFQSMFHHNLKEKESSTVYIEDMSFESCLALLSYLYGNIKKADFWEHRLALLGAGDKYDIGDLKEDCEESLLEDITSENVFERLQEAWIYQLDKLKKGCLTYLFRFGRIEDMKHKINNFFREADRELTVEMFQEMLTVWKPVW